MQSGAITTPCSEVLGKLICLLLPGLVIMTPSRAGQLAALLSLFPLPAPEKAPTFQMRLGSPKHILNLQELRLVFSGELKEITKIILKGEISLLRRKSWRQITFRANARQHVRVGIISQLGADCHGERTSTSILCFQVAMEGKYGVSEGLSSTLAGRTPCSPTQG